MNLIRKLLFLLIVIGSLQTGYAHTKMLSASFESINANGNYTIYITRSLSHRVEVFGPDAEGVVARVDGNTLILEPTAEEIKNLRERRIEKLAHHTIKIQMPYLHAITLDGETTAYIDHVASYGLKIDTSGYSRVSVKNRIINVDTVCAKDHSKVVICGIKDCRLHVEAGGFARVVVAGSVKILTARIWGNACFYATQLRPKVAFVQTLDCGVAKVLAIHSLYAYATGNSNIYYFKTPKKHFLSTATFSGNVFQMAR